MASEKVTAIVEELKGLTVLELAELVHAVEEEFGVSAAAAVAVAAPTDGGAAAAAEQTEFDVPQQQLQLQLPQTAVQQQPLSRQNLTLSLSQQVLKRLRLSRLFVKSQVLDLKKLRLSLTVLRSPLRKQLARTMLKLSRLSSQKLVLR